jgi:hypothetical protein
MQVRVMAKDRNIPNAKDAYKIITYASGKRKNLLISSTIQISEYNFSLVTKHVILDVSSLIGSLSTKENHKL